MVEFLYLIKISLFYKKELFNILCFSKYVSQFSKFKTFQVILALIVKLQVFLGFQFFLATLNMWLQSFCLRIYYLQVFNNKTTG